MIISSFEIDNTAVLNWPVTVSSFSQLYATPRMITDLTIAQNSMNDNSITVLSFNDLYALRTLTVRSRSLLYIRYIDFTNLPKLETLTIQENCLSRYIDGNKPSDENSRPGCFKIENCTSLKVFTTGDFSMTDYAEFVITGTPALESISFGAFAFVYAYTLELKGLSSCNDVINRYAEFEIRFIRIIHSCIFLENSSWSI